MDEIRKLGPGDEEALEGFLRGHADTSMFLRSNLRLAGIEYRSERFQGDYFGRFVQGRLTAAAGLFWNGNLILQVPDDLEPLLNRIAPSLDRPVEWLSGPWEQVARARGSLGLTATPATYEGRDGLFSLELARLRVPGPLATGKVRCRRPRKAELEGLTDWRISYNADVIGSTDSPEFRRQCREGLESDLDEGVLWVLERNDRLVSMSDFNARLPDIAQIGGVWTPHEFRCNGYARSVVAGSLLEARGWGVERAILFTDSEPAVKAYRALGFRRIGEYGLIRFRDPQDLGGGPV
ncbi:MAG: GNAT family N-acetyltransferase [Planctomycetota bacterium]